MKKLLFIFTVITLMFSTSCSKEEENLPWWQDPEELSHRPIKPTVNEIPVTRPLITQTDVKEQVAYALRSYSWNLFRQKYQVRKESNSADSSILIAPYHVIRKLHKQMESLDEESQQFLASTIGMGDCPLDIMKDYCKEVDTFCYLDEDVMVYNNSDSPTFRAHWLFSTYYTKKETFQKADGNSEEVEMMSKTDGFLHHVSHKYSIAKNRLGSYIYVFFVKPNYNCTIDDVIKAFDPSDLKQGNWRTLRFSMPKFYTKDSHDFGISVMQEQVDIEQVVDLKFSESGICNVEGLWKQNYARNDFVASDVFCLDGPFLYGIVENVTNTLLYIGYYGG